MRRYLAIMLWGGFLLSSCASQEQRVPVPGVEGGWKTAAAVRAQRRAFDGAPPVIAHEELGTSCSSCHHETGVFVPELGYAPASPHDGTPGVGSESRCRQCHVFQRAGDVFAASDFQGLPQNMRRGERMYPGAPPVIPHELFMREDCLACHAGAGAREPIRTTHPERVRCRQCHVEVETDKVFGR